MTLTPVKRAWFVLTLVSDITLAWALLKVINALPHFVINEERKKEISSLISCMLFKLTFFLNPQIRIKSLCDWSMLDKANGPTVLLLNHTSPLDSLFFAAMCPLKHASKFRTLAKSDLFNLPLFGEILKYCGHFPVYFQNAGVGSFSVDKEKQNKVIVDISKHLSNGGGIAFFPEGQLNRFDATKLQAFRLGLFKVFLEHRAELKMFAFLHSGVQKIWHPEAKIGGDSSQVKCNLFPLRFSRDTEVPRLQQLVQQQLDTINATGKIQQSLNINNVRNRPEFSKL